MRLGALLAFGFLFPTFLIAATPKWTVSSGLDTPESVYFDNGSNTLFVSNVAGKPDDKDGKGWISRLSTKGKVLNAKWVDGLDAPKGMRSFKGSLWVTNINELVSIDIKSAKIQKRISVSGAKFLNDLEIDSAGTIFVSDTFGNKIYKISGDQVLPFAEKADLEGPNGLLLKNDELIVAAWGVPNPDWSTKVNGRVYKLNLKTGEKTLMTPQPVGHLDGIEESSSKEVLVSDWIDGKIWKVGSGDPVALFKDLKSPADIGYVPSQSLLVVPLMSESRVEAYSGVK